MAAGGNYPGARPAHPGLSLDAGRRRMHAISRPTELAVAGARRVRVRGDRGRGMEDVTWSALALELSDPRTASVGIPACR
jgi:hypothetical protein